jgi:hypothetical protein
LHLVHQWLLKLKLPVLIKLLYLFLSTMPAKLKADFTVGVEPLQKVFHDWCADNDVGNDVVSALKKVMSVTRALC